MTFLLQSCVFLICQLSLSILDHSISSPTPYYLANFTRKTKHHTEPVHSPFLKCLCLQSLLLYSLFSPFHSDFLQTLHTTPAKANSSFNIASPQGQFSVVTPLHQPAPSDATVALEIPFTHLPGEQTFLMPYYPLIPSLVYFGGFPRALLPLDVLHSCLFFKRLCSFSH